MLGLHCCSGSSLVAARGGDSPVWCAGFSPWWFLLLRSLGSGVRASTVLHVGSRAQAQQLQRRDLEVLWRVGTSCIRDQAHVPCIGRWILYHWTTMEALTYIVKTRSEKEMLRMKDAWHIWRQKVQFGQAEEHYEVASAWKTLRLGRMGSKDGAQITGYSDQNRLGLQNPFFCLLCDLESRTYAPWASTFSPVKWR